MTDTVGNHMTVATLITADIAKTAVHVHPAKDVTGPILETPTGAKIDMPFAIASFFAREAKQDSLLGKTAF